MRARSLLLSLTLVAGCTQGAKEEQKLVITGSSTVAPILSDIARRFEQENPGARVDVQTGGSSRGVADARSGVADLGMVSRALKESEADLTKTTLAMDGLSLIVHKDNAVPALSAEQVVKIYTGEITDWSDVGGAAGKITVVHKAEGRSTLELFLKHFELKNEDVKPSVVIGDNEQGIKTVAGSAAAIGYVSIGVAETDRNAGVPIRLLPLDGVEASTANVKNGTFPLRRELNLVVKGAPSPLAQKLLDYARSDKVKDILAKHAVVPPGA